MAVLNYATSYSQALAQAYPYVLNFGKLYQVENDQRYRWVNSKTIEIPSISTTGRVNSNRDNISTASRNYDNAWEPKTLTNQRKWSTLVHPMDVDQTNLVASIQNITKVFNEEQKFPEMDAYLVSKIYGDWTALGNVAEEIALTTANILEIIDQKMEEMDEARVPANGRILYCDYPTRTLIKNAQGLVRNFNVQNGGNAIDRTISRIEELEIIGVPSALMKTVYNFTSGWQAGVSARQIKMFFVHPSAIITPVSYQFAQLDPPSAGSEGKYVYFEESFEDVFILNKKAGAIKFVIAPAASQSTNTGNDNTAGSGTGTGGNQEATTPSVTLDKETLSLTVGGATGALTATVVPDDSEITWESSDTGVATVSNGTVTAVAAGTATVTAKITVDGTDYTDTCSVTVTA